MSIVPRALTGPASTQKSKVQSLIQISSRSDMGETQGMTHPKANCSLAVNLWNWVCCALPKHNDGPEEDTHPHCKKKKRNKERKSKRSKGSLKPNGKTTLNPKTWGQLLGSMTCFLDTVDRSWTSPPPQFCWVQSTPQLSQGRVEFLQLPRIDSWPCCSPSLGLKGWAHPQASTSILVGTLSSGPQLQQASASAAC